MTGPARRYGGLESFAVAALLAVAAALRLWRLDLGWFGVDQARDIQTALDIAAGIDWPTVGPTMRRVTSLGALYYYFWALPHLASANPLAAYWFAAGLGTATVVGTWVLARRWWGGRAALVALAVLATSRLAVIDGRVAWAPAALPAVGVLLLGLLAEPRPASAARLALLGALLGLALQLHLAMLAWTAAAVLLLALRPPRRRALVAGGLAFLVVAAPALLAAFANAGGDAGLATLPNRGPWPDVPARLVAAVALAWRVPPAFWQWSDGADVVAGAARAATLVLQAIALVGVARLVAPAVRGDARARALLVVGAAQLGMVAVLPGEVWYYYLDALAPWWALAAGAAFATRGAGAGESNAPAAERDRPRDLGAALVIGAALVLAVDGAAWLRTIARHGYLVLDPAPLTLEYGGGRDAATPGRLLTVGSKRAVAAAVAAEPAPLAARWLATHGPAFDDATGDNGFWLLHGGPSGAEPPPAVTHAALWYRDDPSAPAVATPGFALATAGPLLVVRYRASIRYDLCRDANGPITVPVRVVPHPRRYGDGTRALPAALPGRIECAVAAGVGATRVVAAVGTGTVTLHGEDGAVAASGRESTLCVARHADRPAPFAVAIALPAGARSDLDLYERPDPTCGAAKIAP